MEALDQRGALGRDAGRRQSLRIATVNETEVYFDGQIGRAVAVHGSAAGQEMPRILRRANRVFQAGNSMRRSNFRKVSRGFTIVYIHVYGLAQIAS